MTIAYLATTGASYVLTLVGLLPRFSQNRIKLETLSFLGRSRQLSLPLSASPTFIFREKRHTSTPTPPSLFLVRMWYALRSSHTFNPSLICSFSTFRFRSTNAPATPAPHTTSPVLRSYLQHSLGRMFADTRAASLGRRDSERFRRMLTSDQCRRRAARCVRVR